MRSVDARPLYYNYAVTYFDMAGIPSAAFVFDEDLAT